MCEDDEGLLVRVRVYFFSLTASFPQNNARHTVAEKINKYKVKRAPSNRTIVFLFE